MNITNLPNSQLHAHLYNSCDDYLQSSLVNSTSSLSNSCQHSANANVIDNMKSKSTVSCWDFFPIADMIFSATSKVQNYQNKTGEKDLYPSKYVLTTYFKEF